MSSRRSARRELGEPSTPQATPRGRKRSGSTAGPRPSAAAAPPPLAPPSPPPPPRPSAAAPLASWRTPACLLPLLLLMVLLKLLPLGGRPECGAGGAAFYPLCVCPAGAGLELTLQAILARTQCVKCPRNSLKAQAGNAGCSACALWEDTGGLGEARACRACAPGHTRQRTRLGVADATGTSGRSLGCRACRSNTHLPDPRGVCVPCPASTTSEPGSTSCTRCAPGWVRAPSEDACSPCPANTVEAQGECRACGVDEWAAPGSSAPCSPCPSGHVRPAPAPACAACPRNTFRAHQGSPPGQCEPCGLWGFTEGVAQSSCVCARGAWRAAAGLDCAQCPENTLKNGTGNGPCTPVREGYRATEARDREVDASAWQKAGAMTRTGWSIVDYTVGGVVRGVVGVGLTVKSALESFWELLQKMYAQGWGREKDFETDFKASGGAGASGGWAGADEELPQEQRQRGCPWEDGEALWAFVQRQAELKDLQRARSKADAKAAYRRLILQYHPDKFITLYRGCPSACMVLHLTAPPPSAPRFPLSQRAAFSPLAARLLHPPGTRPLKSTSLKHRLCR